MSHQGQLRRPEVVLIAGPTASGKSALAMRLAAHLNGRIINVDSMQVYRDLRILTARPSEADTARVEHRLYGTIDGAETYSVSRWLADARVELEGCRRDGMLPILVGGTGLYFKALIQGLSDIPSVPPEVRRDIRRWAQDRSPGDLHAELVRRDPLAAKRLRPTDPQRILRALEVHAASGESLVTFQDRRAPSVVEPAAALGITLTIDRTILGERIARRAEQMFASDAFAEVERLVDRQLDPALPIMRAIGVAQAMRYAAGATAIEVAIAETALASRQYVKRQETFFRNQFNGFRPLMPAEAEAYVRAAYQS